MKVLHLDQMLEVAIESDMPGVGAAIAEVEKAAAQFAQLLASHLGVGIALYHGQAANFEHEGGLCATFIPLHKNQVCPPGIDECDRGGDWETPESLNA